MACRDYKVFLGLQIFGPFSWWHKQLSKLYNHLYMFNKQYVYSLYTTSFWQELANAQYSGVYIMMLISRLFIATWQLSSHPIAIFD